MIDYGIPKIIMCTGEYLMLDISKMYNKKKN